MSTESLRTAVARAIHDGPNAQDQYVKAGIFPHTFDDCSWREQYVADADAALDVLAGLVRDGIVDLPASLAHRRTKEQS